MSTRVREVVDSCILLQDTLEELLGPLIQKDIINEEDYRKLSNLAKDVYDKSMALNDDEGVTGASPSTTSMSSSPSSSPSSSSTSSITAMISSKVLAIEMYKTVIADPDYFIELVENLHVHYRTPTRYAKASAMAIFWLLRTEVEEADVNTWYKGSHTSAPAYLNADHVKLFAERIITLDGLEKCSYILWQNWLEDWDDENDIGDADPTWYVLRIMNVLLTITPPKYLNLMKMDEDVLPALRFSLATASSESIAYLATLLANRLSS
tara:strand:+ start:817 stop:1614 length:798 start_codon:yes stop_codon:yes gene_type:complete